MVEEELKKKRVRAKKNHARTRANGTSAPKDLQAAIVIENVTPEISGGRFPVKCVVGDTVHVEVDIFKDGHEALAACIKFRPHRSPLWEEAPLAPLVNDRWQGSFIPKQNARFIYTIEAWVDRIATWRRFVEKKAGSELAIKSEADEGVKLLSDLQALMPDAEDRAKLARWIKRLEVSEGISDEVLRIASDPEFEVLVSRIPLKGQPAAYRELELIVGRKRAEYGAWYEMFPRSQGGRKDRSATFRDCVKRLPDIKKMGFDVIYLAPIHPIGTTNRKGPNNTLAAGKNVPGSPWAIGSKAGGHKAIHPDLGSMKDFENFVAAARDYGIEIALDFAIQCSPDHPWVKEHPDWFYRLPDGSIRFAENPPKKYQDIYPINFNCEGKEALWRELAGIVFFWISKGVKIFRVDNPHTKPLRFWRWLIREVEDKYPEVIFLAEAFTRPKVMRFLAKAGFDQSYTYFTWRNYKWELREYLEELTQSEMKYYFRGNFFANTPDILHEYLQRGGPPAFKIRLVFAATLSSTYGIYSGFELCENVPLAPGSEEYLNSEKYEYKVRDWDQPGNIKPYIARVNRIRSQNPALQQYLNLQFFDTRNDNVIAYCKWTTDRTNVIVVVVNLDPFHMHEDLMHFPFWQFGLEGWQTFQMRDLLTGEKYYWKGAHHYIRLDPAAHPAHIFLLRK